MMRNHISYIIGLLLLTGCYNSNEEYFVDIPLPGPAPAVGINTNDIENGDTVELRLSTIQLTISVDSLVNDFIAGYLINNNDTIVIKKIPYTTNLSPGLYDGEIGEITILIFTSTGTESLASKMYLEQYAYKKIFYIEKVEIRPSHLEYISSEVVDGRLKVNFTPYPYKDFGYYLKRFVGSSWSTDTLYSQEGFFIETGYVENLRGEAEFEMISYDSLGKLVKLAYLGDFGFNLPEIQLELDSTTAFIKWNKTKFYNNFSRYEFEDVRGEYPFDGNYLPSYYYKEDINDTVLKVEYFPFGHVTGFYFRFQSKEGYNYPYYLCYLGIGEETPLDWGIVAGEPIIGSSHFMTKDTYSGPIKFYNTQTNSYENTIGSEDLDIDYLFSSNMGTNAAYTSENKYFSIIDVNNQNVKETINTRDYVLENYGITIPDNRNSPDRAIDDYGNIYFIYEDFLYIHNLDDNTKRRLAYSDHGNDYQHMMEVSKDGDYLISDEYKLYKIETDTIKLENDFADIKESNGKVYFIRGENYCLIINTTSNKYMVYDIINQNILYSYSFDGMKLSRVGLERKTIVFRETETNMINVKDIYTGVTLYRNKTNANFYNTAGGYIYSDRSRRLKYTK